MKIDIDILLDKLDLFDKIYKIIEVEGDKVDTIRISTYGIYTGILDDGRYVNEWAPKYHNNVGELLDVLSEIGISTHIKIGIPIPIKCDLYSDDLCGAAIKKDKWGKRFGQMSSKWPNIKFELSEKLHAKMILIGPSHCFWGSTNLSDSDIFDIVTYTKDLEMYDRLKKMFDAIEIIVAKP